MQQILFNVWVLAHLHTYFVLHNSTEKNMVQNVLFTSYLLPTRLFGLHVYLVTDYIVVCSMQACLVCNAYDNLIEILNKHYEKASNTNFVQMFIHFYLVAQNSLSEELELCKYIL